MKRIYQLSAISSGRYNRLLSFTAIAPESEEAAFGPLFLRVFKSFQLDPPPL